MVFSPTRNHSQKATGSTLKYAISRLGNGKRLRPEHCGKVNSIAAITINAYQLHISTQVKLFLGFCFSAQLLLSDP